MKLSNKNIVSWSQFTTSLAHPHRLLGFKSSRSASPCGASSTSSVFLSFRARSSRGSPLIRAFMADVYVPNRPFSVGPGPVRCIGSSAWSSRARSGFVFRLPEYAWGKAAMARSGSSGTCLLTLPLDFVFDPLLSSSGEVGSFLIRLRPKTWYCVV